MSYNYTEDFSQSSDNIARSDRVNTSRSRPGLLDERIVDLLCCPNKRSRWDHFKSSQEDLEILWSDE